MGSHKCLSGIWLTFPDSVRLELSKKEIYLISNEAVRKGMEILFGNTSYEMDKGAILIALDLMSVYSELLPKVEQYVSTIVKNANEKGKKVYYKYHPRETMNMKALKDCYELDRTKALEDYLVNTSAKDLTVIGFKSTALQTAKKMGYSTISYIKQLEPNNIAVLNFYLKIGIICK